MAGNRVEIRGLKALDRALSRVPESVSGEILSDATEAAAEEFLDFMVATAPQKTGQLAGSLRTEEGTATGFKAEWMVGATAQGFHGMFQEKGTLYIAAQPWIRPAFDHGRRPALAAAKRVLVAAVRRIRG